MLNNLKHWILGTPPEERTEKPKVKKEKQPTNTDTVVDWQQNMIDLIVGYFNSLRGKEEFNESFVIWVSHNNPQCQSIVADEKFGKALQTELENRELTAASKASITFKTENPPQDAGFYELKNETISGIFIQRIENSVEIKPTVSELAKITVSKGKGSLMQNEYTLDASKKIAYNVGRGENFNNHIIINDSENDPKYEINCQVSREHAKIVFVPKKGFYLQSRNVTNRTIINRNNERFADLVDLDTKTLLQNNDEIELGKAVCLTFEIIDN